MGLTRKADYAFYLYTCNRCASCFIWEKDGKTTYCPAYNFFKLFSFTGGGKLYLAQGILDGKVPVDENLGKIVYTCMNCSACEAHCPAGISIMPVIKALREEAFEKKVAPDAILKLVENVKKHNAPYPIMRKRKEKILPNLKPSSSPDVFLFWGCSHFSGERTVSSAIHFARLLEKSGIKYSFPQKELCCGAILYHLGDTRSAKIKKREFIDFINSLPAQKIVFFSPECYVNFLSENNLKKEVTFYTDVLLEISGKNSLALPKNSKITFHDPCLMARGAEREQNLKRLLETLGIEPVYPPRCGRETFCCGGGFGVREVNERFVHFTVKTRLEELFSSQADTVVTSCPRCLENLTEGAKRFRIPLKVMDAGELFEE